MNDLNVRLCVVQHGDYVEGLRVVEQDLPEPYADMKASVRFMEKFLESTTYQLISVDAPNYRITRPGGVLIGLHKPNWPKLGRSWWSWSVYRHVRRFKPTHLFMRTGGLLALPSISYAVRRRAKCIAIMAGYWSDDSIERRFVNKRLARLLNDPCVFAAANHCRPATNSMLPFGLNPEKVFAWDFNKLPNPEQIPVKTRQSSDRIDIAFAGVLKFGKGIQDIVRAVQLLRARGVDVKLTVCGDGPVMPDVRQAAAGDPEGYQLLGFVDNHEVHRVFSQATLVCVASRKDHSEGLPLVISEALATRTPLIASDHPSMLDVLVESEGVRFFPSGDAEQLATVIQELGHDVDQYRHLSETAAAAIGRIDSDITIYDLLTRWRATW